MDYRAFGSDEIRSEDLTQRNSDFPHIYGPIARSAIRAILPLQSVGDKEIWFGPAHPMFDRLSSRLSVRLATSIDDGKALALFRCRMLMEMHSEQFGDVDFIALLERSEDYYNRYAFDQRHASFILCAVVNVVGAGTLIIEEKPPRPDRTRNMSGYVPDIYVMPEYRENGGARLIMALIHEEAARRGTYQLSEHASDMGLPRYASMGYRTNSAYLECESTRE